VVDCCGNDAGTDPPAAQCQSENGSLACVGAGRSEDDLIRSCSHRRGNYLSSLIQGLGGQAARSMEPGWIAPARLLRIKPCLARILEHRLARRTVQEDLGNRMRHASKLAREPASSRAAVRQREPPKTQPLHR
jgi:hypothetical protein